MGARESFETTTDRSEQTLGAIAVELPGATALFRELKLDFCCGGNVSLRQAVAAHGLDLQDVQRKLQALEHSDELPEEVTVGELIDHILTRYHAVHREQLPELIRMARRVEAVHRDSPAVPAGLAVALESLQETLFNHLGTEEQVLFPMMRNGGHPQMAASIDMMRQDHAHQGQALAKLGALTNNATPPQGACNTWRALYTGLAQFSDDLQTRIHLEGNVLFAAFEAPAQPAAGGCCGGGCGGH